MVVALNRLVRGTHVGTDLDTGKQRLYIANAVLERTKQKAPTVDHDIVKQEVKDENDPQLYYRRWPERFEPVHGQAPTGDPELQMKPGETLNQFAARIGELAKKTVTTEQVLSPVQTQPNSAPPLTHLPPADMSTFDAMTVEELKAHAEGEEIPLGTATKKAEILKLVKAAYGVQ